jgi:1,4-alpha-glucan branching enzyme
MKKKVNNPKSVTPPRLDKKPRTPAVRHDASLLSDYDIYLFNEGSHYELYEKLGAHPLTVRGVTGTYFAVWAPNASAVYVVGDFNRWDRTRHRLQQRGKSGIWEGFIGGIKRGSYYKYYIVSRYHHYTVEKADPFAFFAETPPKTGSIIWDLDYAWGDHAWMQNRHERNALAAPIAIYEVHLGSWQRVPEEGNRYLTYREIAPKLADYVKQLGFTHVEFLPVMEHPFYGSWGYQTTGYFSPTSRYGSPQDFMYLMDYLHRQNIGVILDWVPSHFPDDQHALGFFDGTHLFEHKDPVQGIHPDWNSYIFNYGRDEVRSFLKSSAMFWLNKYHADGLRVDAVASMLYLDYGRKDGKWVPNKLGGRENLDAIAFLKQLNEIIYLEKPDIQTIAEESTAWPMVSRPTYSGGLGFGMKWDMGWMHDTLVYMSRDPVYRKYHQNDLTFRMIYAFTENYALPLSHDEVVYGKASLLSKMPGDDWQKFANLRLLYAYMYAQPGKKILFMGGEFGQRREWSHESSLDWHLLQYQPHASLQRWVSDLNKLYCSEPSLHRFDFEPAGFEWIDTADTQHSILSFIRHGRSPDDLIVVVGNFTPETHLNYDIGVPLAGTWQEVLNSDAAAYGGSGQGNPGTIKTSKKVWHGRPYTITLTLPPLAMIFLKPQKPESDNL